MYILYRMLHLRCGDIPLIYISWLLMDTKGDNRHRKSLTGILQSLGLKLFPIKLTKICTCYHHENLIWHLYRGWNIWPRQIWVLNTHFRDWSTVSDPSPDTHGLLPIWIANGLAGWVRGRWSFKLLASLAEQTNTSVLSATDPFIPDWHHLPPRTPHDSWNPGKTNSGWYPPHAQRIRLWPHRSLLMAPIGHTKSLPQDLLSFASY